MSTDHLRRRDRRPLAAALVGAVAAALLVPTADAAAHLLKDTPLVYMVAPLEGQDPRPGLALQFGCVYGSDAVDAQVFTWKTGMCDALVRVVRDQEMTDLVDLADEVELFTLPARVTVTDPAIAATCISLPQWGRSVWGLLRGQTLPGHEVPPQPTGLTPAQERGNMLRYSRLARALQLIAEKTLLLEAGTPVPVFPVGAPAPALLLIPAKTTVTVDEPLGLRLLLANRWSWDLRVPRIAVDCAVHESETELTLTAQDVDARASTFPVRWLLPGGSSLSGDDIALGSGETIELQAAVVLPRPGRWRLKARGIARPREWDGWSPGDSWLTGHLETIGEPVITVTPPTASPP